MYGRYFAEVVFCFFFFYINGNDCVWPFAWSKKLVEIQSHASYHNFLYQQLKNPVTWLALGVGISSLGNVYLYIYIYGSVNRIY